MQSIEIRYSKRWLVFVLCSSIVFVAVAVIFVLTERWFLKLVGAASLALFSFSAYSAIRELLVPRPCAVLDNNGILVRRFESEVLPWADIAGAHVQHLIHGGPLVWLQIRNPNRWKLPPSIDGDRMFMQNRKHGYASLAISLTGTAADASEIQRIICAMSAAASDR